MHHTIIQLLVLLLIHSTSSRTSLIGAAFDLSFGIQPPRIKNDILYVVHGRTDDDGRRRRWTTTTTTTMHDDGRTTTTTALGDTGAQGAWGLMYEYIHIYIYHYIILYYIVLYYPIFYHVIRNYKYIKHIYIYIYI